MDRLTRKELKTDKFAAEVGQTVAFLEEHRREATILGIALVVLAVVGAGLYFYFSRQHVERQALLYEALQDYNGTIGPQNPFTESFATKEEKQKAVEASFRKLTDGYPGSDEAMVAHIYLGIMAADEGRSEEAEKQLKFVVDSGDQPYASQAALSLATLYGGTGRVADGEKLLRNLIEHPTILVSKEQATVALAELFMDSRPDEARKLLEPLRGERSAVSRAVLTLLGRLEGAPTP